MMGGGGTAPAPTNLSSSAPSPAIGSSAMAAPPTWTSPATDQLGGGGANPVIDGKQFFRQARNSLSYEAFNEFLASIKRLNNQQQSREETLDEARRIFGPENQNLYADFAQLLNRHAV